MRRVLNRRLNNRNKHSFANPIVHIAPTNAVAAEGQEPDQKRSSIPNDEERHGPPKTALLEAPDTDEPGDQHATKKIGTDVSEANRIGMSQSNRQTPGQTLREREAQVAPRAHVAHPRHPGNALS